LLDRSTATVTGVSARNSAASNAAGAPKRRRTRWKSNATAATPSSAWGTSTLRPWKPNSLTLATWTHIAIGGLSTETKPAGSKAW
jgi:hypothetical protein